MTRWFWLVLVSAQAAAALPPAKSSQSGSDILLRVLVAQIKSTQIFSVSGSKLFLGSQDQATADQISCEFQSGMASLMLWKSPLLESGHWYCQSPAQTAKLGTHLYIHSRDRRIKLGRESFRGHLELIAAKDSLNVINHVPLDAYLASLVNSEMSASFPKAALKAQVIAARSYALSTTLERRKKMWPFDLYNTQIDQVYLGMRYETEQSWKLAEDTTRQVLTHNGAVLRAYYHSSSGGHLELPQNVWSAKDRAPQSLAYQAKPNPYDQHLAGGTWQITLSRDLGQQIQASGPFKSIKVLERTEGQRVKTLLITGVRGTTRLSGVQFRNLFGPGWIKSALFDVTQKGNSFVLSGRGWGHGVGMSQWGAKVMADSGKSAEQILKFYYPGANVSVYGRGSSRVPPPGVPANISAR